MSSNNVYKKIGDGSAIDETGVNGTTACDSSGNKPKRARTEKPDAPPSSAKETTAKAGELPFLTPPRCASIPTAESPNEESRASSCKMNMLSCIQKEGSNDGDDDNHVIDTDTSPSASLSRQQIRNLLLTEARGYDINSTSNAMHKRTDYLTWDDYFMAVSSLSAQRSKDPDTQVGACIVDAENRIVGIGYNGFPRGCSDDCLPWASLEDHEKEWDKKDNGGNDDSKGTCESRVLHTKNPYVCHAEVNAILNKCCASVANCRMYIAHFPCNESAKIIIQSRIQEVVYLRNTQPDLDTYRASRIMFEMAGVKLRQYKPTTPSIILDFGPPENNDEMINEKKNEEMNKCIKANKDNASISPKEEDDKKKYRDLMVREAQYDPMKPITSKRSNYLSWDDYFMAISFLSAQRSKDPNTQVGACIVNSQQAIIGIGYNGFPRGCSDDHLPWSRKSDTSELHKKYPYVCHAEVNAILNKGSADVNGATLYVALFPCNDCAKVIIQAGIREVVYMRDIYHDTDQCRASRIMFSMSGVKTRQHRPAERKIPIDFGELPDH